MSSNFFMLDMAEVCKWWFIGDDAKIIYIYQALLLLWLYGEMLNKNIWYW